MSVYDSNTLRRLQLVEVEILREITRICQKFSIRYFLIGGTLLGAALASLITQILTSIILPLFIKDLRPNTKLMLESMILKDVFIKKDKKKGKD